MSINKWIKVLYTYNGKLFSYKKEQSTDTCYYVHEDWKQYVSEKPDIKSSHIIGFIYVKCSKQELHRDKIEISHFRGWGVMASWVQGSLLKWWKLFCKETEVTVAQHCDLLDATVLNPQIVIFMFYESYFKFFKKSKQTNK